VKVQGGGCCLLKGLSNLTVGMQHLLSCGRFLLQTLLLEQLLLAAAGTGAPQQTAVLWRHSPSAPEGTSKSKQQHPVSPLLPVSHKFLKEVLTQMSSPALTGSFLLGRQTWSVHSRTGILAFRLGFLAGLWLQPGKL